MEALIRFYCHYTEQELQGKSMDEIIGLYSEALFIEERLGVLVQNAVAKAFGGEEK